MNVAANAVEEQAGRTLMPGFHAWWSLGTIAGAGFGALAAHADLAPAATSASASILVAIAAAVFIRHLPNAHETMRQTAEGEHHVPARAGVPLIREVRLLGLGVMCFLAAWAEGAANDWLALMLHDERDASGASAAPGFAVFATAMTLGRVAGNKVVNSWGRVRSFESARSSPPSVVMLLTVPCSPSLCGRAAVGSRHRHRVPARHECRRRDARPRPRRDRHGRDHRLLRLPHRTATDRHDRPGHGTRRRAVGRRRADRRDAGPVRHGATGAAPREPCKADGVPEPLAAALTSLRPLLLDADHLVRAVAAGRRRGAQPLWQRARCAPSTSRTGDGCRWSPTTVRVPARQRGVREGRGRCRGGCRGRCPAGRTVRQLARADHDRDGAAPSDEEG